MTSPKARLAKVIQIVPGRGCNPILDQLDDYIAYQVAGADYRAILTEVADHLDGCLECATAYAQLYDLALAEAAGRLPTPANIPPPDLGFLPSLSQRLQEAVRRFGQQLTLQLSAELLTMLQPRPAGLVMRNGDEDLFLQLEAQPNLPLSLAAYRERLRPEYCQLEVTVQLPGREWPNLAGISVTLHTPAGDVPGQRDKVALGLLVGTGLRREEAVGLAFDQVKLQPVRGKFRTVLQIQGKGDKGRVVPISERLAAALDRWGGVVGGRGRVLRSVNQGGVVGASLSTIGLFQIVRKYGGEIGRPELAPHDLRRTYAQIGYEAGVSITQISKLLGHANVATTQRYLNLDLDLETTVSDFILF